MSQIPIPGFSSLTTPIGEPARDPVVFNHFNSRSTRLMGLVAEDPKFIGESGSQFRPQPQTGFIDSVRRGLNRETTILKSVAGHAFGDFGFATQSFDVTPEGTYNYASQKRVWSPNDTPRSEWTNFIDPGILKIMQGVDFSPEDGQSFQSWRQKVNNTATRRGAEQMAAHDGSWLAGTVATGLDLVTDPLNFISFGTLTGIKAAAGVGRRAVRASHVTRSASVAGVARRGKAVTAIHYLKALEDNPLGGVTKLMGGPSGSTALGLGTMGIGEGVLYAAMTNALEEDTFDKHHSNLEFVLAPMLGLAGMGILNGLIGKGVPALGNKLVTALDLNTDASMLAKTEMIRRSFISKTIGPQRLAEHEAALGEVSEKSINSLVAQTINNSALNRAQFATRLSAWFQDTTDQTLIQKLQHASTLARNGATLDEWGGLFNDKFFTKTGKKITGVKQTRLQILSDLAERDHNALIDATRAGTDPAEVDKIRRRLTSNTGKITKLLTVNLEEESVGANALDLFNVNVTGRTKQGRFAAKQVAPDVRRAGQQQLAATPELIAAQKQVATLVDGLYNDPTFANMPEIIGFLLERDAWNYTRQINPIIKVLQGTVLGPIGALMTPIDKVRKLNRGSFLKDKDLDIFRRMASMIDSTATTMEAFIPGSNFAKMSLYRTAQASNVKANLLGRQWDGLMLEAAKRGENVSDLSIKMLRALAGQDVDGLTKNQLAAVAAARVHFDKVALRGKQARIGIGNTVDNYVPITLRSAAAGRDSRFISSELRDWYLRDLYGNGTDSFGEITHSKTLTQLGWVQLDKNSRIIGIADESKFVPGTQAKVTTPDSKGNVPGIKPEDILPEHRAVYYDRLQADDGALLEETTTAITRRVGGSSDKTEFQQDLTDTRTRQQNVDRARRRKIEQDFWLQDSMVKYIDEDFARINQNYHKRYAVRIDLARQLQEITGLSGVRFEHFMEHGDQVANKLPLGEKRNLALQVMQRIRETYETGILQNTKVRDVSETQIAKALIPLQTLIRGATDSLGVTVALVEVPVAVSKVMLASELREPLKDLTRAFIRSWKGNTRVDDFAHYGEQWEQISLAGRLAGQYPDDPRGVHMHGSFSQRIQGGIQIIKNASTADGDIGPQGTIFDPDAMYDRSLKFVTGVGQVGAVATRTLSLEEVFTSMARNVSRQGVFGRTVLDMQDGVFKKLQGLTVPAEILQMDVGMLQTKAFNKWIQGVSRESGALSRGHLKSGVFRIKDYADHGLLEKDIIQGGQLLVDAAGDDLRIGSLDNAWAAITRMDDVDADKATRFLERLITYSNDIADGTSFRSRPWDRLGGANSDINKFLFSLLSYSSGFYNRILPRLGDEGTAFAAAILPVYIVGEFMQEFIRDMTVRGGSSAEQWERWLLEDDENFFDTRFMQVSGRVPFLGPVGNIMTNLVGQTLDTRPDNFRLWDASPGIAISNSIAGKFMSATRSLLEGDTEDRFNAQAMQAITSLPGVDNLFVSLFKTFGGRLAPEGSAFGEVFRR